MRLLNTETLAFHDVMGEDTPPYSILSHTWDSQSQELTYQDMLDPTETVKAKSGYAKLLSFVNMSRGMGFHYAWVDTCCIDKTSSAELTEAINSMYAWYRGSAICLIYLADVHDEEEDSRSTQGDAAWPKVKHSRWFSRGWTLQELVAPKKIMFFTRDWHCISISDDTLSDITSIPKHVLQSGVTEDISVAQKMCWASNRQTTRVEDMAYCLMGFFDVQMPLLYGEGNKAFIRLQEEIIRRSDDQTIFLWRDPDPDSNGSAIRGMLARHPSEFSDCNDMIRHETLPIDTLSPYSLTNIGLQMSLRLVPIKEALSDSPFAQLALLRHGPNLYIPILRGRAYQAVSVILKRMNRNGSHFARVVPGYTVYLDLEPLARPAFVSSKFQGRIAPKQAYNYNWPKAEQIYVYPSIWVSDISRTQVISGFLVKTSPGLNIRRQDDCHKMSCWNGDVLESLHDSSSSCATMRVEADGELVSSYVVVRVPIKEGKVQDPNLMIISMWWNTCPTFREIQAQLDSSRRSLISQLSSHSFTLIRDCLVVSVDLTRDMFV